MKKIRPLLAMSMCANMLLALIATPVLADDVGMPANMPKSYISECASCHTAYAPGLLPEKSWKNIMESLGKHYGSDASIDAKSASEISAWLQKNASRSRKFSEVPPDNRITQSAWFARKHDEIGKEVWQRSSIKSKSNCSACHQQASKGNFEDDNVRIPK